MSDRGERSDDVAPGTPAVEAITLLYDRHVSMIRGLVHRMCGDRDLVDEIVQDTFLEAQRSWSGFEGRSKASSWLGAIAVRQCQRRWRKRAGEPDRIPSFEELLPFGETTSSLIPGPGETPLETSIRREAADAIHRSILELPDEFRVPLLMKEILELSVADVAEALALNPQTVKSRLHRARLKIREAMRERLPQGPAVDPAYDKQTCIDLMAAKLDAQDSGRAFPVANEILCDRCLSVFKELDLAVDLCRVQGLPEPSREDRETLLRQLFEAGRGPTD